VEKTAFVAMGNIGAIPGALIAGAVDAGVITPPQDLQLRNGPTKFNNLGFLGDFAPGITGGVAASSKILKESPDTVRAFLRAHAKAHQFLLNNRDEALPIISRFLNLSPQDAAFAYETTVLKYYTKGGSLSKQKQEEFVAEQVRGFNLTTHPDPTTFFDFSLLPDGAR
jgi:ABC-type nitrate/sulfonate/bicarbonate transport system substrate-binding protein